MEISGPWDSFMLLLLQMAETWWYMIMDQSVVEQLQNRNKRIIEAVIRKAQKECPDSIALIGIGGSFYTGDIHENSDLDLCIIINDSAGWKVASCFILGDVAHDIYCTPWEKLERMAEYNDPYITKLIDLDIVYCKDNTYLQRYMALREKAAALLSTPFSAADLIQVKKHYDTAKLKYADIMMSDDIYACQFATARMLYFVEFVVYMVNKAYVRRGVRRIPEDISELMYLPVDFMEFYRGLVEADTADTMKASATALMRCVKDYLTGIEERMREKSPITTANLIGTYEEIHSNWKNKMHLAA
jgi:predicted nucleotidyltransferase